jgi:hypothetical protein
MVLLVRTATCRPQPRVSAGDDEKGGADVRRCKDGIECDVTGQD